MLGIFCMCLSLTALAAEPKVFKHLTVFGDSLSDNGNLYNLTFHMVPKSPPYFEGRFSNGPVWLESVLRTYWGNNKAGSDDIVDEQLQKRLNDYAVGGAGAIFSEKEVLPYTLWTELTDYLVRDNGTDIDSTLFMVWIGGNNYLRAPENVEELTTEVVTGIENGIKRLVKHGASMIVIGNLPDLGYMPESDRYGTRELTHQLSVVHNEKLAQMYERLKQEYPNVNFIYMDAFTLFNEALANPSAFGVSDTEHPCYEGGYFFSPQLRGLMGNAGAMNQNVSDEALKSYLMSQARQQEQSVSEATIDAYLKNAVLREAIVNGYQAANKKHGLITAEDGNTTCEGYLFWDHVHPTTHVHQFIAKLFLDTVKDAGVFPGA